MTTRMHAAARPAGRRPSAPRRLARRVAVAVRAAPHWHRLVAVGITGSTTRLSYDSGGIAWGAASALLLAAMWAGVFLYGAGTCAVAGCGEPSCRRLVVLLKPNGAVDSVCPKRCARHTEALVSALVPRYTSVAALVGAAGAEHPPTYRVEAV